MTQYDRLKNGTATVAQINAEIAAAAARKPLYKRIPAHVLVEEFLIPNNLEGRHLTHYASIHPDIVRKFIRGEVRIDRPMAEKLGGMFRTGPNYWLEVQDAYDNGKL